MNRRQGFVLFVAFVLYLVLGGTVFRSLENDVYVQAPTSEIAAVSEFKDFLFSNASEGLPLEEWHSLVTSAYESYVEHVHHNTTHRYWTFFDAFFFSLTVVTTIGYGNLCPMTIEGRFFCIFYALFGIPMAGILLAAIGDFFSGKLLAAHEKSKQNSRHPRLALTFHTINYLIPGCILFLFLPATVFMTLEQWTYLEAFYYSFITLTTIGFGDYVAGTNASDRQWLYKVGLMCWIVFGLGYLSTILNFITKVMKSKHVQKIEKTVSRNIRYTQLAFNKELAGFMRQMNDFYANKVKMRAFVANADKKLKRTSSCPSIAPDHEEEHCNLKRSASADSVTDEHYADQAESSANFIFELAMAMACGTVERQADDAVGSSKESSSSRRGSIAQLKSFLNPASATAKKRNSIAIGMHHQHHLENNMASAFRNFHLGSDLKNDKNKKMSSSSLFDNFVFPPFGSGRRSNRNMSADVGKPTVVLNGGGGGGPRRRSVSHPEETEFDRFHPNERSMSRLRREVDGMANNCRWFIGTDEPSDDDSTTPSSMKTKESATKKGGKTESNQIVISPSNKPGTLAFYPRHELEEVIDEEHFDSVSVKSSPKTPTSSTSDVMIDIEDVTTGERRTEESSVKGKDSKDATHL